MLIVAAQLIYEVRALFLALYHQAVVSDTLCGVDKIKKKEKQKKPQTIIISAVYDAHDTG